MQREIKKKTATYGVVAVVLAVLLTVLCYNLGFQPSVQPTFSQLKTFSSYDELKNFLTVSMEQARGSEGQHLFSLFRGGEAEIESLDVYEAAPGHSTTNIQVAGVDEADIVKTDGEHLYVVSGCNIYILKAYPPDQASVLSKITLNETYGPEIYVNEDKLAVLGNRYQYAFAMPEDIRTPYTYGGTFVKVYDISDRANPVLTRTLSLNGTLSGSRMIGSYVYAVVNQPAISSSDNETEFDVLLPRIASGGFAKYVQPSEIRYINVSDVFYYFTTVVAVNVIDDMQEPTHETFLTGATSCMYVSLSNMYLAVPNTNVWIAPLEAGEAREETLIFRVNLDGDKVVCEAEGAVSGYMLNQFSMDEYKGFFRIATTKWTNDGSKNNLYILNMSLNIVGKLEDLAPGERIYSARFMGDRCYLVTFMQIDPFFVIDVGTPTEPTVLGYLKIPGFSGYLHPYDENHVIGVGIEENKAKLSFFDVTNVTNPLEIHKYVVEGDWSSTPVLSDHKAFLFDKSKQLLALPVSINWISWIEVEDTYYAKGFWQGAYVFNISLGEGFVLKGNVTHQDSTTLFEAGFEVKRILYIDNVLYTVSDKKIEMNDLEDLVLLKEIELS